MKTMKTHNIILIAIMAGALAIAAFTGDYVTENGTTGTSGDKDRLKTIATIQADVENHGGDVICTRSRSFLFVDYDENRILSVYAAPGGQNVQAGVTIKEDVSDDTLRRYGEDLCENGFLETVENDVDRAIENA